LGLPTTNSAISALMDSLEIPRRISFQWQNCTFLIEKLRKFDNFKSGKILLKPVKQMKLRKKWWLQKLIFGHFTHVVLQECESLTGPLAGKNKNKR